MEETLKALSGILVRALPTFFIVLLLHFFIKRMFFKPLGRVLDERRAATEGARKAAELSLQRAQEKAAAYESAIRDARTGIYKELEELRRQWRAEQDAEFSAVRGQTEELVKEAKKQIAGEVAASKTDLAARSDELANEIVGTLISRRVN